MLGESYVRNFEKTDRESLEQKKTLQEETIVAVKTKKFQQVIYLSLSRW